MQEISGLGKEILVSEEDPFLMGIVILLCENLHNIFVSILIYKPSIFYLIWYIYEIWLVTLKEGEKNVSENIWMAEIWIKMGICDTIEQGCTNSPKI
jgi:hypothetical protein